MSKKLDLLGQRFGRLVVIEEVGKNKHGLYAWNCKCDCGNEVEATTGNLKSGSTKSCGCLRKETVSDRFTVEEKIGTRYGRLIILRKADDVLWGTRVGWVCKCDCGEEIVVSGKHLRSGHTQSCGCFCKDQARNAMCTHGQSKTRLYSTWAGMIARCTEGNKTRYKNYEGRGIKVCDAWLSFEVFYEWALSSGYEEHLIIDRIDNDGNYCPENCRWVTYEKSANNRRYVKLVEYKGQIKTLSEWAKALNMNVYTLRGRYYAGWTPERMLTTPIKKHKEKKI